MKTKTTKPKPEQRRCELASCNKRLPAKSKPSKRFCRATCRGRASELRAAAPQSTTELVATEQQQPAANEQQQPAANERHAVGIAANEHEPPAGTDPAAQPVPDEAEPGPQLAPAAPQPATEDIFAHLSAAIDALPPRERRKLKTLLTNKPTQIRAALEATLNPPQ